MSRFFAAGSDSDSSLSDQESHKSSDEEQQSKTKKHSMWLKKDSDSDSEEEAKKVVRSQSDKRTDELRAKAKSLANALNIQDWVQAHVEFDALQKLNSKHFTQMPRFYVRALVELNAAIADVPSKKMNKSTNKAYGVVSQKIKKLFKSHQVEIKTFVDNPVNEEDSADEAEELAAKELEEKTLLPKKVTEPDADMMNTDDFIVVGASKSSVAEVYTSHRIFKTLDEILLARGKKSTDKSSQITQLSSLLLKSSTPYQKLKIFLALISARFDLQFSTPSLEMWASSCNEIAMVFQILEENEHIIIKDMPIDDTIPENIVDSKSVLGELTIISGSITSYIDLLEDEFNKSLLSIDCHTLDYIERLKDEIKVYGLLVKTEKYARKVGCDVTVIDLLMMKRVEHLYYKPDSVICTFESEGGVDVVSNLCVMLYKTKNDRVRTRALLCHIYNVAMHDRFYEARDMMLMSHLQDSVSQTDILTQILFNRAMVQIGLCAFRCGLFREAHICLQEIQSCGKTKELLAQGVAIAKDKVEDKTEKSRQLPFHMHINLELLECVYLTCAMLLEVPNIALHSQDSRRKVISKSFRRMLDYNDRQIFTGPPENSRDYIMAASKAMGMGEWIQCNFFITNMKVWDFLSNAELVKEKLTLKIQQESLRTYILAHAMYYGDFDTKVLGNMFSLPVDHVIQIVSKMILHDELNAEFDASFDTIVMESRATPGDMTRLEYVEQVFVDKVTVLVENSDKLGDFFSKIDGNGRLAVQGKKARV